MDDYFKLPVSKIHFCFLTYSHKAIMFFTGHPSKYRTRLVPFNLDHELISDVLLWTPSQGWAKAERPALTYIQQLCVDTGCSLEDLLEAMNDKEGWQ